VIVTLNGVPRSRKIMIPRSAYGPRLGHPCPSGTNGILSRSVTSVGHNPGVLPSVRAIIW